VELGFTLCAQPPNCIWEPQLSLYAHGVLNFSGNKPELGLAMQRDGHISIIFSRIGYQSHESEPKMQATNSMQPKLIGPPPRESRHPYFMKPKGSLPWS
jgi:hypothetical protein